MKLPISNFRTAIKKAVSANIFIGVSVMFSAAYVDYPEFGFLIVLLLIFRGAYYIAKNNIKEAIIEKEYLELKIRHKSIKILYSEILSINKTTSIGSPGGTYSATYYVKLRSKYTFGTTLLFDFCSNKSFIEDPIEIQIIKSKITNRNIE